MKNRVNLRTYIDMVGREKFCTMVGVTPQVMYNWYHLKSLPRPELLTEIVKTSRGKITYADIIEPFVTHRNSISN